MNERLTSRAVLGMFAKGLSEVTTPAWVDAISWLNASSDQFAEEYRWLDQNPSFREWVGGRQAVQLGDNGVIVEHGPPATFFSKAKDPRTKEFLSQIL